jgi:hypothetical protein
VNLCCIRQRTLQASRSITCVTSLEERCRNALLGGVNMSNEECDVALQNIQESAKEALDAIEKFKQRLNEDESLRQALQDALMNRQLVKKSA